MIQQSIRPLAAVRLPLSKAAGLTLAADVYAVTDIPAFPQSSMDGYAFLFQGWQQNRELLINGEAAAGTTSERQVSPRNAVRIFTGAAVPPGADTVIMQEKTKTENGKLIIEAVHVQQGANVRQQGSEIKAGALALPTGSRLAPAAIGFLAGIGIADVAVHPYPAVTLIITGNELQQPGTKPEYGKVYDANSFSLQAALERLHIPDVGIRHVPDEPEILTNVLQDALRESDVVLLTGGASVGDYDFVIEAATRSGVAPLFHKIKQRPGKPLFFGKRDEKLVFGLPGNPSSVLTCFYVYVLPALEKLSRIDLGFRTVRAPLGKPYQKTTDLTHYLKGFYDGEQALPLDAQESYRMHSFARSNCLIEIGEDTKHCAAGTLVDVHLLPV